MRFNDIRFVCLQHFMSMSSACVSACAHLRLSSCNMSTTTLNTIMTNARIVRRRLPIYVYFLFFFLRVRVCVYVLSDSYIHMFE